MSTVPNYSFPQVKLDTMLWHRRFGHIGMDTTKATLTKEYVKGVHLEGPFIRDHCIPCLVGKSPQCSYSFHGHRATKIGELLHMDLCGPFPVQAPHGEKYFFNILDDKTNWGFTFGLRLKSDAFSFYAKTEAFLERSSAAIVLTVHCGGELELTAGKMGVHFASKGITVQRTVAYAHQQNGKSERYIRMIEEGGQALLADSGLPMSFWLDAVLTRQYLVNRLPTSTLPANITPFESLTAGRKPDLSHLRVWGCDCYVAIPDEIRGKAGPKRFRAIFVGYEEHRIGWRIRDLSGKYSFSNDVIFNENIPARLGVPRPIPSSISDISTPSSARPLCDRPRIRTTAGQSYDAVMELKRFRCEERQRKVLLGNNVAVNGGASVVVNGGEVGDTALYGGVDVMNSVNIIPGFAGGVSDLSPSMEAIESLISFLNSSSLSNHFDMDSLAEVETDLIHSFFSISDPFVFKAFSPPFSQPLDLSKPPLSYTEAIARPDAHVWHSAMDRERQSLMDMGAFEEVILPKGERTVGLKWVFDIKTDAEGHRIHGKEKARLVAQGFNQRPGQYDETYAPVAKMASVRILLAWAAVKDLEIFQFDCKTTFLHAKICHPLYARPFPGYPISTPGMSLRILVALYGLRQSAYEFYIFIMSLLLDLGMVRCEVDHGVFFGEWTTPPDPSISMPPDGGPLVLYVPIHVDDGLGITNSKPLYTWFLSILAKRLHIVDMGPCAKFLNVLIIRDRPGRRLWFSPRLYITELLEEWNLSSCRSVSTPFPSTLPDSSSVPSNSLPDISDSDLLPQYQRLVGCLLYLAISTRPDIAYYAMWLGQYNARPTRAHFLLAKHVLRYLAGTRTLALLFGTPSPRIPSSLSGYIQNVGCSDADWASDTVDRRSISGYSFFFQGSLVSWSAVKQKSIALSSTEAEYYAMAHAFKEALWLRTFLELLRFPVPRPFPILCDNQAACSLSNSLAVSARSKHIDVRHHFLRDHVQAGSFSTTWIPTEDMPADIFTKSLPSIVFSRHREW
jgi:Reverse transcriptase (RNA-dependent DNA polymerase)/GAG-pre-integrase domain